MIFQFVRVSPEPLLIIFMLFIIFLLLSIDYSKENFAPTWKPILIGIIIGCGIFTKITFWPFVLLVFWFSTWRNRIISFFSLIFTSLLISVPVLYKLESFMNWVFNLISRTGNYGTGEKGVLLDTASMIRNLLNLIQNEPMFFTALFFFIIWQIIIWKNGSIKSIKMKRATTITVIIFIQLMMVAKFPKPHYLIPCLTLMGIIFIWIISGSKENNRFSHKKIQYLLFIILLGMAIINMNNLFLSVQTYYRSIFQAAKEINNDLKSKYSNCIVIPYYGASSQIYALSFGNDFAGKIFSEELNIQYPDGFITYNIWNKKFYSSGISMDKSEISQLLLNNKCVLMRGGNDLAPNSKWENIDFLLTPIISKSEEFVYQLSGIE